MTGIALMGAGRMAKVHAQSIIAAGATINAIYDPVPEAATALASATGAKVFTTPEAAIADAGTHAVMIASSSDTHIDLLYQAVAHNKPTLCEKPLASNFGAAREFVEKVGEQAAKKIFLGFNRRFDTGHAALRENVHSGQIGRLEQLVITSRDPYPPPLNYIPVSGGLFRDMMIHDFDMARAIVNRPIVSITAHGSSIIDPEIGKLGDVDTATVTMIADDGTIITILNSRRCAFGYDQRIEAFGAEGMLISDNPKSNALLRFNKTQNHNQSPIFEFFMDRYGASYTQEIAIFLDCAKTGQDMPVNAIDGLMASYLAEAATASLKQGKTIALSDIHQTF